MVTIKNGLWINLSCLGLKEETEGLQAEKEVSITFLYRIKKGCRRDILFFLLFSLPVVVVHALCAY